ncbi:hypothetical protein MNV49_007384 [Pseudohyphozyma bogoriensis]|nr:hypothetical protein MNV49_007384 [Pseudohyphozyma bogoriensis]
MLGSLLFDTVYTARERLSRGSDGVEAATRGTFAVAVQPSSILIPNQDVESAPDLLLARGHVLACVSAELPAAPDFVAPKAEHGYFENFEAHFRRDPIKVPSALLVKGRFQLTVCAAAVRRARLYNEGVHLNMKEYGAFREAAELAAQRKQSLLILPNHKSYIPSDLHHDRLKKTGGAFIKRPFGEDPLYPIIVKEYLEQLLGDGINMEIFIEGTRSRTGKLLPPKVGMLKYVIDALQMGRTSDVIICPVSIQYSNVLELDTFSDELLGVPKTPESLAGLVVNGGKALQTHIQGMVKHDLLRRVGWLKSALALKGVEEGPLRDLSGAEIIVQSLDPLGDALTIRSDDVDSVFLPTKPFVLALYRNQLANTFVLEGILAVSLIGRSTPATDAFERATFLSTLLQQEFVFPPEGVKSNFEDAVSQLSLARPPLHQHILDDGGYR